MSSKDHQTDKRILVLGSAPHTRQITSYAWDNLPDDLNVADYDVVILNFCPLHSSEYTENKSWQKNFPGKDQFMRLMFSESEIIAIGVPMPENKSTGWLPINPDFIFNSGEQVVEISSDFEYYFKKVRRWSFHGDAKTFMPKVDNSLAQVIVNPGGHSLALEITPIVESRFQRPVAFNLRYAVYTSNVDLQNRAKNRIQQSSHHIYWLPPTTEISDYEAVNLILRERYGLLLEQEKPEWVKQYKLPDQLPIEGEIKAHERDIQDLTAKLVSRQSLNDG